MPPAPAECRFDAQRLEDAVPLKPDYPLMLGRRQAAGKTANCAEEILLGASMCVTLGNVSVASTD